MGDEKLEAAGAGVEASLPVAVFLGGALGRGAPSEARADLRRDLGFHDLVAEEANRLPHQVGVIVGEDLAHERVGVQVSCGRPSRPPSIGSLA